MTLARAIRLKSGVEIPRVELSADDMSQLDALEEGLVTGWDPRSAP
jgi:hypothetical protein